MRCPKCGYISFDHLEVCVKCKKNIKAVSDTLRGTVFQVQAPSFLQLQPRQAEDETEDDVLVAQSEEYVDDDLEILIEEPQDKELDFGEDDQPELKSEAGKKSADDEEEDREIEIDFSQFEDAPDEEPTLAEEGPTEDAREEKSFSLEMPEALADISDLAPPAKMAEADNEPSPVARKSATDDDELDFNLGLDDLDLPPASDSPAETELSLDELDFSDTLAQNPPKAAGKTTADMDEELNFDLDLGGLSIHKDQ